MTRGSDVRRSVSLACAECSARNYKTTRRDEPKVDEEGAIVKGPNASLEFRKFCKQCQKHTVHREAR